MKTPLDLFSQIRKRNHEWRVTKQTQAAVDVLIEESHLDERFVVMTLLSSSVATCGIILSDTSILIAAMVLAPFLNAVLSVAAGVVMRHKGLVLFGLEAFLAAFAAAVISTSILTYGLMYFLEIDLVLSEALEKFENTRTLVLVLIVSFMSGFGAVYSWLKSTGGANLVGIAIAVALVPFISLYGISFGMADFSIFPLLTKVFLSNITAIFLGAISAFLFMGVKSSKKEIDKGIKKAKDKEIF